ncbi:ABC transporter ATP-binding protein [Aliikangiella coralliicola]|uniref:ABC transporter ATP-binding protein n=1 Tax=Aliikangiella coralliicola TaxID=2592383 RepID=A0A545UCB3_9GAMM|nr:ABC transporter ATP-binding protein [Aliikangiella coralliicola]TQV87105.1 ABC transporter ATP-binding protein [Aliikangiella coralliicola]
MLTTQNLHIRYGQNAVVKGINLSVGQGELVAVVGPNGCGKSTLLKALAKLETPHQGEVFLSGNSLAKLNRKKLARKIALLPQHPVAPEGITVEELVGYGRYPYQSLLRQWSKEDARIVADVMARAQVNQFAKRRLSSLSGGQRQKAWLAMVLAQQTPLLLLDEPTSALDMGHQIEVLKLIKEQTASNTSILIVMHDLAAAARYADRIIAMKDGKIIADGKPQQVVTSALIRSLYSVDANILEAPCDGTPVIVAKSEPEQPSRLPQMSPDSDTTKPTKPEKLVA